MIIITPYLRLGWVGCKSIAGAMQSTPRVQALTSWLRQACWAQFYAKVDLADKWVWSYGVWVVYGKRMCAACPLPNSEAMATNSETTGAEITPQDEDKTSHERSVLATNPPPPPVPQSRASLVDLAVKFLTNPRVTGSPMDQKRAFLTKKGDLIQYLRHLNIM